MPRLAAVAVRYALASLVCAAAVCTRAVAAPSVVSTGPSPIVNISLDGGKLAIKTWKRQAVAIVASGRVTWNYYGAKQVAGHVQPVLNVFAETVNGDGHRIELPSEVFALPASVMAPHDDVMIAGTGDTTVTVPEGTAFVWAHVKKRGSIDLQGFRGGAFFLTVSNGGIALRRVAGVGFAQTLHGRIVAVNSSFYRLRVRTGSGNVAFERCTVTQIEATSGLGDIIFDRGTFLPGLARFESQYGAVAIGVMGGASVGAHSGTGVVRTSFHTKASVVRRPAGAEAILGGGGARVTASSENGPVILYDGGLSEHPGLARGLPRLAVFSRRSIRPAPAVVRIPRLAAPRRRR